MTSFKYVGSDSYVKQNYYLLWFSFSWMAIILPCLYNSVKLMSGVMYACLIMITKMKSIVSYYRGNLVKKIIVLLYFLICVKNFKG
jgi:hypothetical protein